MNYYELRDLIGEKLAYSFMPNRLCSTKKQNRSAVEEKGRKSGYREFKLNCPGKSIPQERLLNTEEVRSFVEVSCRAAACPMPLNIDVWDGLLCPFGCLYCYANAFRASLYTAFFDNSKTMGFRHCNPEMYKRELDVIFSRVRGMDPHEVRGDISKAIALEIPMRFGIRFEDFLADEGRQKIGLDLLRFLRDNEYPLMINSKSALLQRDDYVRALADNPAGTAVHVTLISSDDRILRALEPGAPSYKERISTMRALSDAGVRAIARIEPFLPFVCDKQEDVQRYIEDVWDAGVRHITFDTYSYTAKNQGIRQSFIDAGFDWDRIFRLGCESQGFGSLLLGKFMEIFREAGFSCSTFDMGNVPDNDQSVCCEVGDLFENSGFNYGCTVYAARMIASRARRGRTTSWEQFEGWVNSKGGFLSDTLQREVHQLWNCRGNDAYSHYWAKGLEPRGYDENGIIWGANQSDFREELLSCLK